MFGARSIVEVLRASVPSSGYVEASGDLPESFELRFDGVTESDSHGFIETEGRVEETPSRFFSSGGLRLDTRTREALHELRLVEGRDGYSLEGNHLQRVGSGTTAVLESTEGVRATLESALGGVSETLGNRIDVTVESHEVNQETHGRGRFVEAEYTAGLDGLRRLTAGANGGDSALGVREAVVSVSCGDETVATWEFDIYNHRRLFATVLGDSGYEDAEAVEAARRLSGFGETVEWWAERGTNVAGSMSYDSVYAEEYIDELRRRGVRTPPHTAFEFEADTRGTSTDISFDLETDGSLRTRPSDRAENWVPFVPLPFAPLVAYLS